MSQTKEMELLQALKLDDAIAKHIQDAFNKLKIEFGARFDEEKYKSIINVEGALKAIADAIKDFYKPEDLTTLISLLQEIDDDDINIPAGIILIQIINNTLYRYYSNIPLAKYIN